MLSLPSRNTSWSALRTSLDRRNTSCNFAPHWRLCREASEPPQLSSSRHHRNHANAIFGTHQTNLLTLDPIHRPTIFVLNVREWHTFSLRAFCSHTLCVLSTHECFMCSQVPHLLPDFSASYPRSKRTPFLVVVLALAAFSANTIQRKNCSCALICALVAQNATRV